MTEKCNYCVHRNTSECKKFPCSSYILKDGIVTVVHDDGIGTLSESKAVDRDGDIWKIEAIKEMEE